LGERYVERALGSDRAEIARRSAVRRAKEIKAGVTLVHGGRDVRVSPEHAKAMRKALDEAGVPYEGHFPALLTYPWVIIVPGAVGRSRRV
jgi:dipeptidyl aminopeptidase/acylaminoacyl peptidase